VRIRWCNAEAEREISGYTRDISRSGVFVDSQSCPTVGDEVQVEVRLAGLRVAGGFELRLRAAGRVVRLAGSGEESGFAAQAEFRLYRSKESEAMSHDLAH
jgi:hypothetical protein